MSAATSSNHKIYKLHDAIALVERHGFRRVHVREEDLEANRLVYILQQFMPRGDEYADFRLARGKYRGNSCGSAGRGDWRN